MSMQKHIGSRHLAIVQAIGYLGEYIRLRGHCQEVYFNIARACHQLLITHIAMHYYEKVLAMEPVGSTPEERSSIKIKTFPKLFDGYITLAVTALPVNSKPNKIVNKYPYMATKSILKLSTALQIPI
ncbi:unnamed protein product [Heterobilharzia americana]|nr:unnamed protein product [Heterobilharzia americana]